MKKPKSWDQIRNFFIGVNELGQPMYLLMPIDTTFQAPSRPPNAFGIQDRVNGAEKVESAYIGQGGA